MRRRSRGVERLTLHDLKTRGRVEVAATRLASERSPDAHGGLPPTHPLEITCLHLRTDEYGLTEPTSDHEVGSRPHRSAITSRIECRIWPILSCSDSLELRDRRNCALVGPDHSYCSPSSYLSLCTYHSVASPAPRPCSGAIQHRHRRVPDHSPFLYHHRICALPRYTTRTLR